MSRSRISAGIQSWLTFACQLVALVLFSLFAFSRNPGRLMAGNDGPTSISLADVQQSFFGISLHLHGNILESLGNNITFPWNLSVIPSFWLRDFAHVTTFDIAVLYSSFAVMLFLSVLLIGWNYRFSTRINYTAAWFLTLLSFPYFESFRIYSITASAPFFECIIMVFAVMDVGIQNMGVGSWFKTVFYGLVFLLGLVMGLVICPASLMLIAPVLMVTTIYSFIKASSRAENIRKLMMLLLIFVFSMALGWVHFFLGLILNTAASFFSDDMVGITHELIYSSILFQSHLAGMGMGIWLFCGCTLGCLYAVWKRTEFRSLALAVLCGQLLIAGGGAILMSLPEPWGGPAPVYCELMLFPFYALFLTYLVAQLIEKLPLPSVFLNRSIDRIYPFVMTAMIGVYLIVIPAKTERVGNYGLTPASTSMTDILEKEIAIRENSEFRGRVVNILEGQGWITQLHYFSQMNVDIGNDHQTTGLWLKRIPTLHEYNQLISPGFYSLYRRFLSDSLDAPYRSWSNFNKINTNILRLFGVRYILTTKPAIKDTIHLVKLTFNEKLPALHMYELKGANTAGISTTRVVTANNVREAEDLMSARNFDLHDAIVAPHTQANGSYVPATNSKLSFEKGGIHLQAQSKARTLLILPIEFSHCLSVKTLSGDKPEIIRVDVALAGIKFNRHVNIIIDTHTGPFSNPRCRWEDYREFAQFWKNKPVS